MMPNAPRVDLVRKAICSGIFGHIQWKDSAVILVRGDRDLQGITPEEIRALLREYVSDLSGMIDFRTDVDKRPEYVAEDPDNPYWYRVRIPVPEFNKGLFVEIILVDYDEHEPWVEIVSAHR